MDYKYFPHTEDDLKAMMDKVGVKDLDGLYAQIPDAIRFKNDYQLPSEMSEIEVRQLFDKLGYQVCCSAQNSLRHILRIRQRFLRAHCTISLSTRV